MKLNELVKVLEVNEIVAISEAKVVKGGYSYPRKLVWGAIEKNGRIASFVEENGERKVISVVANGSTLEIIIEIQ